MAKKVFISYSHNDKRYLGELQTHLKPVIRTEDIDVWDDTRIQAGQEWHEEILAALNDCCVAILLVSPGFLASDYIYRYELPALLDASKDRGVVILPVIVSTCRFKQSELARFMSVNNPTRPLRDQRPGERDAIWVKLVEDVEGALQQWQNSQMGKISNDGSALAEVIDLLASAENLAAAFGAELNVADPTQRVEKIVDRLWQTEIGVFEKIAFKVFKAIAADDEHSLGNLQQVLNVMLPILYDQDTVDSVHAELMNSTFVQLPVKTKTVAEIVMAAVGKRPALYREPLDGSSWPVGRSLLDEPPEMGFSDPKQGMVAAFDQFLIEKYVDSEDRSKNIIVSRQLINDALAWIAEELGGEDSHRHYLILDQQVIGEQMEQIDTLRSVYPQITFVVLQDDPNLLPDERRLARPLRAILAARKEEAKK